jgi:hypothetical protein
LPLRRPRKERNRVKQFHTEGWNKIMIMCRFNGADSLEMIQQAVPPMVYLDHWALRKFSQDKARSLDHNLEVTGWHPCAFMVKCGQVYEGHGGGTGPPGRRVDWGYFATCFSPRNPTI